MELAEPIAETLESGTLRGLEDAAPLAEQVFPHLPIRTRGYPTSPRCAVEMAGKVVWQEKKVDKKGTESTKQHTKECFDTTVPPGLAEALEEAMGLSRT